MKRLKTILALGDSLTEGFGVPAEASFPAVLQQLLRERGHNISIINQGLSGDTVSGGLKRLERYLANRPRPDAVIVELGANDAIQFNDTWDVEATLDKILLRLTELEIPFLFTGLQMPIPSDEEYKTSFEEIYTKLAERYDPVYYPSFLEGVQGKIELNLDDGIHPNIAGTALIAGNILPFAEALLDRIR